MQCVDHGPIASIMNQLLRQMVHYLDNNSIFPERKPAKLPRQWLNCLSKRPVDAIIDFLPSFAIAVSDGSAGAALVGIEKDVDVRIDLADDGIIDVEEVV